MLLGIEMLKAFVAFWMLITLCSLGEAFVRKGWRSNVDVGLHHFLLTQSYAIDVGLESYV